MIRVLTISLLTKLKNMKQTEPRELLGRLIGETHRLWRTRMDERLKPLGLSQARWTTLRVLARHGDAMPQTELAARVGVEAPTLVGILDGLVRDGYVSRRASTNDRRVKTIHLTAKAQRKSEQIDQIAKKLRAEIIQSINADELNTAVRVLDSVKNTLMDLAGEKAAAKAIRGKQTRSSRSS